MKLAKRSLILLAVQAVLVCSIAAKYLHERRTCPHVWTRAMAIDPELPMRGRYLSLQLMVDGCSSTLPTSSRAEFPRDVNGAVMSPHYEVRPGVPMQFQAKLVARGSKLIAERLPEPDGAGDGQWVFAMAGAPCEEMRVFRPVSFYVSESAASPLPLKPGGELWIEVTLPPAGPPRPVQLALKQDGAWKPLAYR